MIILAPGSLSTGSPAGCAPLVLKRGDGTMYCQACVWAAPCRGSSVAARDRAC